MPPSSYHGVEVVAMVLGGPDVRVLPSRPPRVAHHWHRLRPEPDRVRRRQVQRKYIHLWPAAPRVLPGEVAVLRRCSGRKAIGGVRSEQRSD